MRPLLVIGALVGAFVLNIMVLPAYAQAVLDVQHARGRLAIASIPKIVVVFDLASLDVLDALGIQVAGVPRGPKPAHLAKYEGSQYAKVGTLFEPDYEAVNALSPDLVIVGLRSSPKYDALAKIAPTIDMTVDAIDLVGSGKQRALALARLFGKEAEAQARIARRGARSRATWGRGAASSSARR